MIREASRFYEKKEWFTFIKLFEIDSNGEFVYKNQVKEFIEAFFINTNNDLGLRAKKEFQKTKNILLFVPSINVQEKLVALMKEIFALHKMDNYYSVDFTNSKVNNGKTLKKWIQNNTRTSKIVNIVIAVDQLSCGVTLPTCDMVVLWNDSVSESEYIQRTERCKNPKDGVENVYVVDFNPHRCLQSHGTQIETTAKKEINTNLVSEYLSHINIMVYDGSNKFKIIDPGVFVKHYEQYNYSLKNFTRLKFNEKFDDEAEEYLSHTNLFSAKNTKTVTLLDSDLGRADGIKNKEIISSDRTRESKKKENERLLQKRMHQALQPFYHILNRFQNKRPEDIFKSFLDL